MNVSRCVLYTVYIVLPLVALGQDIEAWDIEDEDPHQLHWDPNGYIFYCPCMGRFGNQAEYLLGALGFAKGLNRTLVLPPFRSDRMRSDPFDEYFLVRPLRDYHRVILASHFMKHFAQSLWPVGSRLGWCYHTGHERKQQHGCAMKEGVPFAPFWDSLGVDFDDYVFHDIGFDDYFYPDWIRRYPAKKYPVLALKGAPARFPVEEQFSPNHQYLHWSYAIEDESQHYIRKTFQGDKFIGIHLRNDLDWNQACEYLETDNLPRYMSSAQCYGYHSNTRIPKTVCLPSRTVIVSLVTRVAKEHGISHVFIAADKDPMIHLFTDLVPGVSFHYLDPYRPQIDLAILASSDVFIGNCISSFSAFVSRHRKHHSPDKMNYYWGLD